MPNDKGFEEVWKSFCKNIREVNEQMEIITDCLNEENHYRMYEANIHIQEGYQWVYHAIANNRQNH